jgi:hypothetical protein
MLEGVRPKSEALKKGSISCNKDPFIPKNTIDMIWT